MSRGGVRLQQFPGLGSIVIKYGCKNCFHRGESLIWWSCGSVFVFRSGDLDFCRRRIDNPFYFRDTIRRKSSLRGVFAHGRLIRSDIHAINLVVGHIAFKPLDLRPDLLEDAARLL